MFKKKSQQGFVAIIVASLLMIILTLIVLGLSKLMQRESRQSLDRQLSTQAFYAAESGVNDVQARTGSITGSKTDCNVTDWPTVGANGVIDPSDPSVAYTCLNYDTTPGELEFNNGSINTQSSKIFPVQSANGGNVSSIQLEWSGADGLKSISEPCSQGFPVSRANAVPLLRVDLIRYPTATDIFRDTIIDQTSTVYLYPQDSCGSDNGAFGNYTAVVGVGQRGSVVSVNCDSGADYACSFNFTGIDTALLPSDRYLVRLKTIYGNADVRVNATSTNGLPFEFVGAQVMVDSTGRANDVLRRIKVFLSVSINYPLPEYVIHSMDGVCKYLSVAPPDTFIDDC